jgi:hypothetical protein
MLENKMKDMNELDFRILLSSLITRINESDMWGIITIKETEEFKQALQACEKD